MDDWSPIRTRCVLVSFFRINTSIAGMPNPYSSSVLGFSSTNLSATSEARLVIMEFTAAPSALNAKGAVMRQLSPAPRCRTIGSAPNLRNSRPTICDVGRSSNLVKVASGAFWSFAPLEAARSSSRKDHQTPPPSSTARPRAAYNRRSFMMPLSPLQPNHDAGADRQQRQHELAEGANGEDLGAAQVHRAVVRVLGANRDQVLVGGEPVTHVHE